MSRPVDLASWLTQPAGTAPAVPAPQPYSYQAAQAVPAPSPALAARDVSAQLALMLVACGDCGSGCNPATVTLLLRMLQQHLQSLAVLLLDTSRARVALASTAASASVSASASAAASSSAAGPPAVSAAAQAAASSVLDGQGVVAVLRAAGHERAAAQVVEALAQHKALTQHCGLEVDLGGREEIESWALWNERAPLPTAPGVREGQEERSKLTGLALGDALHTFVPKPADAHHPGAGTAGAGTAGAGTAAAHASSSAAAAHPK